MMKKLMAFTLALTTCVSMLAACGGGNSDVQTNGGTNDTASGGAKNVELTFGWWGAEGRHAYTQELAQKYMDEHEGVKITFQPNSWDGYWEKMATQAAGNNMPTIIQMDHAFINNYASNGLLYDLTPFVEDGTLNLENINPELLESGKVDGKMVGVVLSQSARAVTINKKSLAEAGLEMPSADWTWEDYEKLCLTYTEKTGNPAVDSYDSYMSMLAATLRQQGLNFYNEAQDGLGFDSYEPLVPFFSTWERLVKAGACITPDQNVTLLQLPSEQTLVSTGKALLRYHANTFPSWAKNEDLVLNVMPHLEGGQYGNWAKPGMYFSIAANTDEATAREAAKFINWWLNSEEVADVQGTDRGIPASSAICEYMMGKEDITPLDVDTFHYFDIMADRSTACPPADPPCANELNAEGMVILESLLSGKCNAQEAAQTFYDKMTEILARSAS